MGWFNFGKKKKKSSQEIQLLGITGQIATLKCLILARIKDVPLQTTLAPYTVGVDQVKSYQYLADSTRSPTVEHDGSKLSGTTAILTYLDIRGTGASLTPRKARILGQQNYWIDICYQVLAPVTAAVTTGRATDNDHQLLKKLLNSLNNLLTENLYVVGPMSFADPHVAAYVHALSCSGVDIASYPKIGDWVARLETDMGGPLDIEYLQMDSTKFSVAGQVA
jgi:glutathione S-transferase